AAAVDDAIDVQRSLVRTWLMRGTLHLCAADDLHWLLGVLGPVNHWKNSSRRRQLGLDDALCARSVRIMRRALANGPMTRHELRTKLIAKGVPIEPAGQAMIHLLAYAAHHGVIVVGPQRGRDGMFVLLDDWVPASSGPTGEAAIEELARRYLGAFRPAPRGDFAH